MNDGVEPKRQSLISTLTMQTDSATSYSAMPSIVNLHNSFESMQTGIPLQTSSLNAHQFHLPISRAIPLPLNYSFDPYQPLRPSYLSSPSFYSYSPIVQSTDHFPINAGYYAPWARLQSHSLFDSLYQPLLRYDPNRYFTSTANLDELEIVTNALSIMNKEGLNYLAAKQEAAARIQQQRTIQGLRQYQSRPVPSVVQEYSPELLTSNEPLASSPFEPSLSFQTELPAQARSSKAKMPPLSPFRVKEESELKANRDNSEDMVKSRFLSSRAISGSIERIQFQRQKSLSAISIQERKSRIRDLHEESKRLFLELVFSNFSLAATDRIEIKNLVAAGKISKAKKKINSLYHKIPLLSEEQRTLGFDVWLRKQYENQGWEQIESTITTLGKNFCSIVTPSNMFNLNLNGVETNLFEIPKHQGISSTNAFFSHNIVNLWGSHLKAERGEELFKGLRHAGLTYCPTDKLNKELNQVVVKEKAKKLILAALYSKYKEQIEKRINRELANNTPLSLKLCSVSLLTLFDIKFQRLQESGETQFFQQKKALEDIQAELTEVTLGGVSIPVQLELLCFSTGVNDLGMGTPSPLALINRNGWHKADKVNQASLLALLGNLEPSNPIGGWVGEYLNSLGQSAEDKLQKKKIQKLTYEIRHIFKHKLHHSENGQRYALPIRIIYLSYLIGAMPCYNCKSGKDRTAAVEAEVNALAANLNSQMEPETEISTKIANDSLVAFHLDPAHYLIQRLNTAASGNKIMENRVSSLKAILTPEEQSLIAGVV